MRAKGQDPLFTKIDKSNGLPGNAIYHIFQDSKGYMWFSSDIGLIQYDGFAFKIFSNTRQSSKSGTNIREDRYGRIWYQNFDGYVFYVENDSLHSLSQNVPVGYFNYGIVGDHLFLMQSEGLDVYDLKSLQVKKHIAIQVKNVSSTACDLQHYYIYSDTVMHVLDGNLSDHHVTIPDVLRLNGGSKFLDAQSCVYVYAASNSVVTHCYQVGKNAIEPAFSLKTDHIQNASYAGDSFWFCTANGAYQYDRQGVLQNGSEPYFKGSNISYVFKDRENNYWFSTLNSGLLLVRNLGTRQYFNAIHPIRSALYRDDLLLGAGEGKLYQVNLQDLSIKEVYTSPYNKEITSLYYDSVHQTTLISNGEMEFLDPSFHCIWHASGAVKDVRLIDSNYYALAQSGAYSLYKINTTKADRWTAIYDRYKDADVAYANFSLGTRAKAVEYDAANHYIYVGTSYGLKVLRPEGTTEIKLDTARLYITKLCQYQHVIYGLSTVGELFRIVGANVSRMDLPLIDQTGPVTFMKISGHYLFITTNENLFSIDLHDPALKMHHQHRINYDITDLELWHQQLIMVTQNGIIKEQLHTDEDQKASPLFYITGFMVNSRAFDLQGPMELRYDQNDIEIRYAILSFKTGFTYPLYYKINNTAWERATDQARILKLSSLAPGSYTITFKLGELNNQIFGEQALEFTIRKAWWQTWWFVGSWVLLMILVVVSMARWRIHELKQKNKLLNEKIENEQKFYKTSLKAIKAQMNPHFFYNALNTIQSFIYSEDKKNASTYLAKFSKLTRLILEMSEKDNITLAEELNTLQLYLDIEKVRFNDDFEFSLHYSGEVDSNFVLFPPMLIQPYVENAIKHGLLHKKGRKVLDIRFELKDQLLLVSIDDNGIGRRLSGEINSRKSQKHESFSSVANEQRLKILSERHALSSVQITDKLDAYQQPAGTLVQVMIPIILTQK